MLKLQLGFNYRNLQHVALTEQKATLAPFLIPTEGLTHRHKLLVVSDTPVNLPDQTVQNHFSILKEKCNSNLSSSLSSSKPQASRPLLDNHWPISRLSREWQRSPRLASKTPSINSRSRNRTSNRQLRCRITCTTSSLRWPQTKHSSRMPQQTVSSNSHSSSSSSRSSTHLVPLQSQTSRLVQGQWATVPRSVMEASRTQT